MTTPEHTYIIRTVQHSDDAALYELICRTLAEFGCVGPGFASADPCLFSLSTFYAPGQWTERDPDSGASRIMGQFWVVCPTENPAQVLGCGGFSRLEGTYQDEAVCELQKLYFDPVLRGQGLGRRFIEQCICAATEAGYRKMYLETVWQMESAVTLYEKLGFSRIAAALGSTGHNSCTVFMERPLSVETNVSTSRVETASVQ